MCDTNSDMAHEEIALHHQHSRSLHPLLQIILFLVAAMPFLSKDEFEEWADNRASTMLWQPMNACGAFCGLCYAAGEALRNLRVLRGASPVKYRVVTHDKPQIEVAQADTEEECLDLLARLNSLTASDVLAAISSNREEVLEQMIDKARKDTEIGTAEGHQEFLSIEMLQKIAFLEGENASLQQELEEARKAIGKKDLEKQELRDEFEAVMAMAQQALAQALAADGPTTFDPAALILTLEDQEASTGESAEMPSNHHHELEDMSFVQQVLQGPFSSSVAKQFWQLAAAPYRARSCHGDRARVEVQGQLWEVIAHNQATETLVVGRQVRGTSILELGFRGTVTEDAYGNTSCANWWYNVQAAAVPLQSPNGEDSAVLVHKGFQDAYVAVKSTVMSWLEKTSKSSTGRPSVRIAGHSLGGALATLTAVDIKQSGWEVDGVVTFGSPKVGMDNFKSLYQDLGLHLRTARFANQYDGIPGLPLSPGFEHVVEDRCFGRWMEGPSIHAHRIEGSYRSYYHTLQDEVDCREDPHRGVCTLNSLVSCAPDAIQRFMGPGAPDAIQRFMGPGDMAHALDSLTHTKQELKADITWYAERMVSAVFAVKKSVGQIQKLKWLVDMEELADIITNYKEKLRTWQEGVPQWFLLYKLKLRKLLEAAKLELNEKSELAPNLVMLYMEAAHLLRAAMKASGACPTDVRRELGDFLAKAKGLVLRCFHLDTQQMNKILRLLPDDFELPEDVSVSLPGQILELRRPRCLEFGSTFLRLLKWTGKAHLHSLKIKLDQQQEAIPDIHIDTILSQIAKNLPFNLSSLALDFRGCDHITDALVQQIASNLPENLTSLTLDFGGCNKVTDASAQQIAGNLPQRLVSLNLNFGQCRKVTGSSTQLIARKLPENLISLSLDFSQCQKVTSTCAEKIGLNLPKSLTSLSLNLRQCWLLADACVQQVASNLQKSLVSLSLDFRECWRITDASVEQIARNLPTNLTSLSLDFGGCSKITDASVQKIASNLPKNLLSLILGFRLCKNITDASVQSIVSNLPKNLTSLSLDFGSCKIIGDASLKQIASSLPQDLTSLSLMFCRHWLIANASMQQFDSILPGLPKNLTSVSLGVDRV